ncbi:MAG: DUF4388 domain-containing protein [Pseudomonadota bacterium]|nr:DUF4388 domain-containing protein [Pseudomonadota bacterium]
MSLPQVAKGLNADLENFELTDVMQLITQQVKCGLLSVDGDDGSCSWAFKDGSLVDFNCHFPGHSLDLETILIEGCDLEEQRFLAFLEEHASNPTHAVERALLKNKIISREELQKLNLRRLIESFIITLQWVKGRYKFIPTSEIKSNPFLPPQDTNFIILEAMRQIDEMEVMKKRLQPLDRVYETTLSLDKDDFSTEDSSLFQKGLENQFDPYEFKVYQLFDGKHSLNEILNLSIIGQFHTCRITLDFLDREIITPRALESTNRSYTKSTKNYHHLTGIALLLLSGALLISIFTSTRHFEKPGKEKKPTFFTAIIDNLRADQQKTREQARELLDRIKFKE